LRLKTKLHLLHFSLITSAMGSIFLAVASHSYWFVFVALFAGAGSWCELEMRRLLLEPRCRCGALRRESPCEVALSGETLTALSKLPQAPDDDY